jgi:hypothetical protein
MQDIDTPKATALFQSLRNLEELLPMKKFWTFVATLLIASTSVAWGGSTPTPVAVLSISYGGQFVIVNLPLASVTGMPQCAVTNDGEYHFAFDVTAVGGNAMLASLIAAQSAGETVVFFGTGTCTLRNGWETIAATRIPN